MITKLVIKNFKRLSDTNISLSNTVVFVGPNNSGKTSALQAIALWDIGMRKWAENRLKSQAKQRVGVLIHRTEILAIPLPAINQLWHNLHVRDSIKIDTQKYKPQNILITISAEGFTKGKNWQLGFEFYYANPDALYCRRIEPKDKFPEIVLQEKIGFLPPMSGLASEEDLMQKGSINVRIGQGRTAEVLRNLCWIIWDENKEKWSQLVDKMAHLFGIRLKAPQYDPTTGRITMSYIESIGVEMDLANAGRGFHQVLLLFAHFYANESTILLLDEPDAHLEILRQKDIYRSLTDLVHEQHSQLIAATHSEVVLNEAAEDDSIIAFLGKPHKVNNQQQLVKSLTTIGFEQYLLAEQRKCILYLEGSTDLSMLQAFAYVLDHPAKKVLENPFVKYVANKPGDARQHFYGLLEGTPNLLGIALYDHLDRSLDQQGKLQEMMWQRCEIENYLPIPEVIERYIDKQPIDLFQHHDIEKIRQIINDYIPNAALKDKTESWWWTTKMSDDILEKIFRKYFETLHMPILVSKRNYYELARLAKPDELDSEIAEKLDTIYKILNKVKHL